MNDKIGSHHRAYPSQAVALIRNLVCLTLFLAFVTTTSPAGGEEASTTGARPTVEAREGASWRATVSPRTVARKTWGSEPTGADPRWSQIQKTAVAEAGETSRSTAWRAEERRSSGLRREELAARQPISLDASLVAKHADDCEWSEDFGKPDFDGPIFAFEMFDDGGGMALYAGGFFTTVSGVPAASIAKWDGTTWSPLGLGILGDVYAMDVFDDGSGPALYVAGSFSVAGGVAAESIARWDGTTWSALGLGLDDDVDTLAVFDDGTGAALYAGGYFSTAGGVAVDYIAQWDGTAWSAVGGGTSGGVYALISFDDGSGTALFAAGDFEFADGIPVYGIAKWDGAAWSDVDEGLSDSAVALAVFDDGGGPALYVGGFFAYAGPFPGVDVYGIARWDGTVWSDLDMGIDSFLGPPGILALSVFDDGGGEDLYAGGDFTIAGPAVPVSNLARWDGTVWSDVGLGTDRPILALKAFDDGSGEDLYAGGLFFTAGDEPAASLGNWDGSAWSQVNPAGVTLDGLDGGVLALATFDDGGGPALYAGGFFETAGPVPALGVARWDGTTWAPLGSGLECISDGGGGMVGDLPASQKGIILPRECFVEVHALAVFDDGSGPALYVGGIFDLAGGALAPNIARWDGTSWSSLDIGTGGAGRMVEALTVFDDGTGAALYAGGNFDFAGGAPASNIARWDGASWTPLGLGVDDDVETLTTFDDGTGETLIAGGEFTSAGGAPASYIASWDGTSWSPLGVGTDDEVETLGVFDDGTGEALYAGGNFTFAGGLIVDYIARWDGAAWSAVGTGMDDEVESLRIYDNGSGPALYAGGFFTLAGGVPASRIARWDGTSWAPLGLGIDDLIESFPSVEALAVWDDGAGPSLYAGGFFTLAGGEPSSFIAEWRCPIFDYGDAPDPTYPTLLASDGARHQVRSGFFLGSAADVEFDGQPSVDALGDDTTETDDEDGVTFTSGLVPEASASVDVEASAAGELDAWVDFNGNGDWDDPGEKIFAGEALSAGINSLTFAVPASATVGSTSARFRLSSAGVALPTGPAPDGEVEDYEVTISAPAVVTIGDVALAEGDAGMTVFAFIVSRSHNLSAASVDFATANGTATAGSDYTALALQTLNFTAGGSLTQMVMVQVSGDTTVEADETFTVELTSPVAATFGDSTGVGTITNDDSAELTVSSVAQAEAAGAMTFTVTLSNPIDIGISVEASTADGTATVADNDYVAISGQTVSFAAETTMATFDVTVNDDGKVESDETFTNALSGLLASGRDVSIGAGGTGTIENDDSAVVTVSSVAQAEAAGAMTFTVTLSSPVDIGISVEASTADGTATVADNDYVAISGQTVSFAPEATMATFDVTINDDSKLENDETFATTLSSLLSGGRDVSIGAGGTGTIENDDEVSLAIDDLVLDEGTGGTTDFSFTVTLSDLSALPISVDFATADGTAEDESGDGDYQSTSGTLTFDPEVTSRTVTVTVNADATEELPTEDFFVDLSNPSLATLADDRGAATITDDDDEGPPLVTVVDTVASTPDGELTDCEEVRSTVDALRVVFDQAVRDPAGDSEPDDVTNPENYRLITAGDDQDLGTDLCGDPVGDDEALLIAAVSYDATTFTAEVTPVGSLPDSAQRLFVCASILDPAGNPLGDGDDFVRTFRVERQNLFVNGQMDCDLESWVAVSTIPTEIEYDAHDVDDASISGSAAVSNMTASTDFSFGQCLNLEGGVDYALAGSVQLAAAPDASVFLNRACELFAAADCAGAPLAATVELFPMVDTAGAWQEVASEVLTPADASSALCSFDLLAPAGDAFDALLDDLEFIAIDPPFFADGFESGDTSAWSSSTP